MAQNQNLTDRARQSAERVAYAAVGAPTAALKAMAARVSDLRDTLRSSRDQMSSELAHEVDEWVTQGEQVIQKALERLRRSNIADDVRTTARSTTGAAKTGLEKAAGVARGGAELIDPDESLTTINGIGPRHADQLRSVDVVGISGLLDRTSTKEGIEELSAAIGVSEGAVGSWRDQIDLSRIEGVGDSYELLLHRVGIWTLEQLAGAESEDLVERMKSIDMPDTPDQIPSESLVEQWKDEARKLST